MGRKKKNHGHAGPHKYVRIRWKSRKKPGESYFIFKCMIPGCSHWVPRELVVGNETVCWRCERTFLMTIPATYLKKPHCLRCTESKKEGPSVDEVTANLDKILGGI